MQYDGVYTIDELEERLVPIFREFDIKHAAVFGSYARGTATPGCDIDMIIKTKEIFDLDRYYDFQEAMWEVLHVNVDVTFEEYINPYMKETIMMEAVELYAD